jgi:hypothetical protein
MNNTWDDILKIHEGCPEEEKLRQYMEGHLNAEEIREVELHLADCEICNDVLEGMETVGDMKKAEHIISTLKQTLKEKQKVKIIRMDWRTFTAIAASLTFMVVFSLFLLTYKTDKPFVSDRGTTMADSNEISLPALISERSPSAHTELPVIEESVSQKAESSGTGGNMLEREKNIIALEIAEDAIEEEEALLEVVEDEEEIAQRGKTKKGKEYSDEDIADVNMANNIREEKAILIQGESAEEQKAAAGLALSAMEALDMAWTSGNPQKIDAAADRILQSDKNNEKALYYKGWSNYQMEKYKVAEFTLKKVWKAGKGVYYEDAQLMLAKTYLQNSASEEAKKLLEEIVEQGGKHAEEARNLLED